MTSALLSCGASAWLHFYPCGQYAADSCDERFREKRWTQDNGGFGSSDTIAFAHRLTHDRLRHTLHDTSFLEKYTGLAIISLLKLLPRSAHTTGYVSTALAAWLASKTQKDFS